GSESGLDLCPRLHILAALPPPSQHIHTLVLYWLALVPKPILCPNPLQPNSQLTTLNVRYHFYYQSLEAQSINGNFTMLCTPANGFGVCLIKNELHILFAYLNHFLNTTTLSRRIMKP